MGCGAGPGDGSMESKRSTGGREEGDMNGTAREGLVAGADLLMLVRMAGHEWARSDEDRMAGRGREDRALTVEASQGTIHGGLAAVLESRCDVEGVPPAESARWMRRYWVITREVAGFEPVRLGVTFDEDEAVSMVAIAAGIGPDEDGPEIEADGTIHTSDERGEVVATPSR